VPGYEIEGVLGRGGMGIVYQARQVRLKRTVALKMILAGDLAGPALLSRFRREAEAVARLQHPNIVQIYEVGEHEGRPYFSLECVGGGTLAARLGGQPQTPRAAALLIETLAQAVHYAHSNGIVHRDLKPANILLSFSHEPPASVTVPLAGGSRLNEGVPKIADFGLAKQLDADQSQTETGAVLGTPSYMAPEQAWGKSKLQAVGPAVDIYALGAILYEMLTGRPPFLGDSALDTLQQVASDAEPVSPTRLQPKVPRDLETICLKCLQKTPSRRYATAADLAADLRRFQSGQTIIARPVSHWERAVKWARRRPLVAALSALCTLLAVVGFALVLGQWQRAEALRHRAEQEAGLKEQQRRRAEQEAGLKEKQRRRAKREAKLKEQQRRRARASQRNAEASARATRAALALAEKRRRKAARALAEARSNLHFHRLALAERELSAHNVDRAAAILDECQGNLRDWEWRYLKRLCYGHLRTLRGHTGPISGVAFRPDGKELATSSIDNTVKVWDAHPGRCLRTLTGHTHFALAVAYSPDGKLLASGASYCDQEKNSWPGEIKLWNAKTGALLRTLRGHAERITRLQFSPDSTRLAAATGDLSNRGERPGEVKVWDVNKGKDILTLKGHKERVNDVAWSPNGELLATACRDEHIRLWNGKTGMLIASWRAHAGGVNGLAFDPKSKVLASAGGDMYLPQPRPGEIKLWDVPTRREIRRLAGHTLPVASVAFSPDGRRLASAGGDFWQSGKAGEVKLWDVASGSEIASLYGHTEKIAQVVFSRDGKRLATSGHDRTVKLWDARLQPAAFTLHDKSMLMVHAVAFSPDGKRLVSASDTYLTDDKLRVWDVATGKQIASLKGHPLRVTVVAWSPDGKTIASASGNYVQPDVPGEIRIWKAANGKLLHTIRGHAGYVSALAFRKDGQQLVSGGFDHLVKVWDVAGGKEVRAFKGHTMPVTGVAFHPDGRRIASAAGVGQTPGKPGELKVWNAATGKEVTSLRGHNSGVWAVAYSPDGRWLASASGVYDLFGDKPGEVKLWNAATGKEVYTLRGHPGQVTGLSFSPTSSRLATIGSDQTVRVWDVRTGQEALTLRGAWYGSAVAFSPDRQRLAAAAGAAIQLWDATPATNK
jgi:WD40 repeat protein